MPERTKEQQEALDQASIIEQTPVSVDVVLFDPKIRMSFRAFGNHLGDVKLEGDAFLSVYAFGGAIEVRHSKHNKVVEFDLSRVIAVAKTLLVK